MHHLPRSGGSVRKSIRPSLDLVERRRQERLVQTDAWWPSGKVVRTACASVLAGIFCSSFAGLAMSAAAVGGGSPLVAADVAVPADAATLPASFVKRRIGFEPDARARAPRSLRAPHRASAVFHVGVRAGSSSRDPSSAPVEPSPAAPSAAQPSPVATTPAASSSILSAAPWTLTADGMWSTTVSLAVPAGVDPSRLDIDWSSDSADVLPLDPNAPGAPGVIVTAAEGTSLSVVASGAQIGSQSVSLASPSISSTTFAAVAQPVGPDVIDVGWAHLPDSTGVTQYKVYRKRSGAKVGALVATVSPNGRAWRDGSVMPDTAYEYTVVASAAAGPVTASTGFVTAPGALPSTSVGAISGKGMFLYFTPDAAGENSYLKYDPSGVIARAESSGITHIEVRMARGTFLEPATAPARAWLDEFIDKAAAAGIKLIAWQVPRRSTSADAATAVAAAEYTTPEGNGFSGLALDIEDGDNYMGDGDVAKQRMVDQIALVREAVGPGYLLVATVMSPALTHWTNARYPFAGIATYASVMQPMEYWHHFYSTTHHAYTQDEVSGACAASVSLTRQQAGRDIPINVAGQSDDLGTTGRPSPDEIAWCLAAAKNAGAIGQTFFDWRGTGDDGWTAIAGFAW